MTEQEQKDIRDVFRRAVNMASKELKRPHRSGRAQ